METNNEVENFLAHFGKVGMKWGHRASRPTTGMTKAAQIATGGLYLGSKSRYKTPEAQSLRRAAGRARIVTLSAYAGRLGAVSVGLVAKNPATKIGAKWLESAFGFVELGSGAVGAVQGVRAVNANKP